MIKDDFDDLVLNCSVKLNYFDSKGCTTKAVSHPKSILQLCRNEFRDIILNIDSGKINLKYTLKDIALHTKFIKEGKATIKLARPNMQVMISNCPPSKLSLFLKTVIAKLERLKSEKSVGTKQRLLSDKPRVVEEISPLSVIDVNILNNRLLNRQIPVDVSQTPKSLKRKRSDVDQKNIRQNILKQSIIQSPACVQLLTNEQKNVLRAVTSGKNIFFTGSAGTGKSFLLKRILGVLAPESTFATASTGVAACQIGGITLHAFAGIGLGNEPIEQCIQHALQKGRALQWKKCQHLIVDEISMVDGEIFQKLEKVARVVRKNDKPFGGIQLILCGDFLQLPPVCKPGQTRMFCFQSSAWAKCIDINIELTEVKRQNDPEFINILQAVRKGCCSHEMVEKLKATSRNKIDKDGILATKLSTHKFDVEMINDTYLKRLSGETHVFSAIDSESGIATFMNSHCPVGDKIELKVGAQVMLTKNLDVQKGLVNGARGVVTGFETGSFCVPIVKFMCGVGEPMKYEKWTVRSANGSLLTRKMIPLKLAWAISIHKSQGMTLDCVEVSLMRVFERGQAYVALSRARSLEGLRVLDIEPSNIKADPNVLSFYEELQLNKMCHQTNLNHYL